MSLSSIGISFLCIIPTFFLTSNLGFKALLTKFIAILAELLLGLILPKLFISLIEFTPILFILFFSLMPSNNSPFS